jgi:brefeldin A-resistance guanine nucleotide exchange factor 1
MSQQISFGLHEILKTTAANIHTTDEWTTIFAILEYVGAGKIPSGQLSQVSFEAPKAQHSSDPSLAVDGGSNGKLSSGGLQHSQSQDPIPMLPPTEYSSGSDRGYTSDSELEIKSQHSSETRFSNVSPAQSWILLAHNTPEETATATPTPSSPSKTLVHERHSSNFTPDSKALMKSCETLSFLVRDAAHITPDNFTICVAAIKSFVEACTVRITGNKPKVSMDGYRKKRGKRHHSMDQPSGSSLTKSKSFPVQTNSSAYDADYESDPEADQAAASQHVSIQVRVLMANFNHF